MNGNEIYESIITGATSEGLGVARLDGRAVFIAGAIPGETVRYRLTKVGHNVVLGELLEVITPAPGRKTPECPHFGDCGGCAFWHMDYETELALKQQRVRDALLRIGGVELDVPITGAPSVTGYRNKAQYPVSTQNGHPVAGFYRAHSHEVVPIARCRIQSPAADACRDAVVAWMVENRVPAYDEKTHRGLVRHIYVRNAVKTGQILLCIVVNGNRLPNTDDLLGRVKATVPAVASIVLAVNRRPGNAILGREFLPLLGPGWIEDELCGLRFRLSPRSFYQVNHDQAERLYSEALRLAALGPDDTVLDLYCGTGTITLLLARAAGQAIGVEVVEEAVADAQENARRNGVGNARFFCADAGQAAQRLAAEGTRPNVIVVDPPRKGLSPDVIDAMVRMSPDRIVYISCDPATLSRDLALLRQTPYVPTSAHAFDLFPRCAHVETVVLLSRAEGN